jgi:arylsulfatase A-like enzyme
MTGCLPARIGLVKGVLMADSANGLDPRETTLPEVLKPRGYATACFGKWHLGHLPQFLPHRQGFDAWFGLPYSHDMRPALLMQEDKVVEENPDFGTLTQRYTDAAIAYAEAHRGGPFLIYLAHNAPHLPVVPGKEFTGVSAKGPYGDVVEELDHEMGRLLDSLDRLDLAKNTLVVYTSDNGPWLSRAGVTHKTTHEKFPDFLGSAGPFRGGKGEAAWEGGHRVPCIWRLPGVIPAGVTSGTLGMHIDILPTVAALCGAVTPTDRGIDGIDVGSALRGEPTQAVRERVLFHYAANGAFKAIRQERWKWYPTEKTLYDLEAEPAEQTNVADAHPDIIARLQPLAEAHAAGMKASARPAGGAAAQTP